METVVTQKKCIACGNQYHFTDVDLDFYKKLDLPGPSMCPICRNQRRMSWRNDRTFYQRRCDFSGEQMISLYPANTPFPVYHPTHWYSDNWDPFKYGREYDFNRPFFEQWQELMLTVPRLGIDIVNCENSDYCNYCGDDKNCYLDIAGEGNEDCYYNLFTKYSKDCADCTFVYNSELCYESISCYECNRARWSMYLENCSDCAFCFDLKGCNNCLFCYNLRHKNYCIFNKEYSREEYEQKLKALNLGSYSGLQEALKEWETVKKQAIHRDMYNSVCENCSGDAIKNSKNCNYVFNVTNSEDCKYLYDVLDAKDCYDLNYSLYKPEVANELISTLAMRYSACCMASHYCNNTFYCDQCNNSSNIFGCIGLNHGEYAILNKKYSKDEYKELVGRIKAQMKEDGSWGEFFPGAINPIGYNETVAQEYYPLTKELAEKKGYKWREIPQPTFTESVYDIPDHIDDATEDISKYVLTCAASGKKFKAIPVEIELYKKLSVPVPRKHPDERHKDRIRQRNPRMLWGRSCSNCGKDIHSSYSPDSAYRIYCEECYTGEVY